MSFTPLKHPIHLFSSSLRHFNSMSILPQNKCPLRSHDHIPIRPRSGFAATTTTTATTTTITTRPKIDKVRVAIESGTSTRSNLATRTSAPPRLDDASLRSTWSHCAWVASGSTVVLISLAKAGIGAATSHTWFEPLLAGYIGYLLADLGSGVYHWGIDNYGDTSTPIFGSQIEAFQGHHKFPWTITKRQFANKLHSLARAVTFAVLPLDLLNDIPTVHGFVGLCSGCILLSQQFHAWAHGTKSKLPPLVVALQDAGVLVSRSQHGAHHRPPYNNNYCIVSGIWNEFLDRNKVFEVFEMVLFFRLGVRPRSWTEPTAEWTEDNDVSS